MERKKNINLNLAIRFLIVFYMVGAIGLLLPQSQVLFEKLIPFSLILSCVLLVLFQEKTGRSSATFFTLIFSMAFVIEVIGVNTGKVFGNYEYGMALGYSILNTPLIIGINWLMLVTGTSNLVNRINIGKPWNLLLGAILMTCLDYLIEPVAIRFQWWNWKGEIIPVQNYIAWFCLSLIFLSIKDRFKLAENKVAFSLIIIQFLFFATLNIALVKIS